MQRNSVLLKELSITTAWVFFLQVIWDCFKFYSHSQASIRMYWIHSMNLSYSKGPSNSWAEEWVCLRLMGILAHSFQGYKQGFTLFDLIMEEQGKA